jgi:hypothetical protein
MRLAQPPTRMGSIIWGPPFRLSTFNLLTQNMGKRKRSQNEGPAIDIISSNDPQLSDINDVVLLNLQGRIERAVGRREIGRCSRHAPSTGSPSSSLASSRNAISTALTDETNAELENDDDFTGNVGQFVWQLTFTFKVVEFLFKVSAGAVVTQVLQRPDPKIEIPRLYSPQNRRLDDVGKFQQYLTDRSLALSHEAYGGSVARFVSSLRQVRNDDKRLAIEGTRRGIRYRRFEKAVGQAGVSAFAAYELSLFRVLGNDDIDKSAKCILSKQFQKVMESATQLTKEVEAAQLKFDKDSNISHYAGPSGKRTIVYTTSQVNKV